MTNLRDTLLSVADAYADELPENWPTGTIPTPAADLLAPFATTAPATAE
jgi:hypothetical protein